MLSAGSYAVGALQLLAVAAAALAGGAAVRRRLLPGWRGAPAWLATATVAIAILIWLGELLGTVGLLDRLPLLLAALLVGAVLHWGLAAGAAAGPGPPAPDPGLPATLAGVGVAAVAIAHFTVGVRLRLSTSMTGFDSTWYHGPFAAGFAQGGSTFDVHFIAPQFLAWFYPQNSELLHGLGMVAFDRDLLSPLLNLGWLSACLAAAWCIGRPYGAGPVSLAAVAVTLDAGALADQAGEARNDLAAIFFVLAALAIAVNAAAANRGRRLADGPLMIAGLAAGLAAGTKLNLVVPALVLVGGLAALSEPGRRWRGLIVGALSAAAGGGFWYLRNLVQAGSPFPWVKHLGPLDLPAPDQPLGGREGHSALGYLTDSSVWSDWFGPGLHHGFGVLWPVLVGLALAGLALALGRRAEPALRVCGAVGIVLLATWVLAPTSASGPDGVPRGFLSGLRYLCPGLAVGMAVLPLAPPLRAPRRRWALLAVLAVLLPFVDASGTPWYSSYLPVAVAAGFVAAAAGVAAVTARPQIPRGLVATGCALLLAVVLVAGERGQRTYLRNRYADPHFTVAGLDAAFRWARGVSGARIATTATRQYPLFGTDLSNRVQFVGLHRPHAGFVRPASCEAWRRALDAGDYDYVVVSRDRFEQGKPPFPPQVAWTAGDPAATVVLRHAPTVVFRLRGPLDPARCRHEAR